MNRFVRWGFALALAPLAACSSSTPAPVAATPAPPALSSADQTFVTAATQASLAEIAAGQLAGTNARSAAVKKFAAMIVDQHTAVNQQLGTLATSKGATVPTTADDAHTQAMTTMQAQKGAVFDRAYARAQVADLQAAIRVYQDEITNGQDADLKAFAQSTLPTLQKQLVAARRLGGGGASTATPIRQRTRAAAPAAAH